MNSSEQLVWRRLLAFANPEAALRRLEELHGSAQNQASNRKKQANQLRTAILQASEYFDAARQSTLYTSANHLYYGTVCLATAIMLLHGTGNNALDVLRQSPENKAHGIEFNTSVAKSTEAAKGRNLLDYSTVIARARGHLLQWYSVLPAERVAGTMTTVWRTSALTSRGPHVVGTMKATPFEYALKNRRFTIANLLSGLPEIITERSLKWSVSGCAIGAMNATHDAQDKFVDWEISLSFPDVSDRTMADAVLDGFKVAWHLHDYASVSEFHNHGLLVKLRTGNLGTVGFRFPDVRALLADTQRLIFSHHENAAPEFADAYLIAFGLSMLARYYPDLWVAAIEARCDSAHAVNVFIETYIQKFPLLALRYLGTEDEFLGTL